MTGAAGRSGPLRVVCAIDSLGPGGAERSLVELLAPLRERGVDVTIATLHEPPVRIPPSEVAGPVHLLAGPGRLQRLRSLHRLLSEVRPDVLHTTLFEADVLGRLVRPVARVPLVCSLVNTTYDRARLHHDPGLTRWKVRGLQTLDAASSPLVDQFHAISDAVAHSARLHLRIRADRIAVIPRGRDRARLGEPSPERRQRVRATLGLGDRRVILTVGRMEPQKGQRHVVEALARLDDDTILLVAGRDGHARAGLEALIRDLGLGARVRILGHRDDVPDLLAAADAFVMPSLFEGLGGALLEAMALDVPIVASDIPAFREAVTPSGALLVPPADPRALAAALQQLVSDPDGTAQRRVVARARFDERYGLAQTADQMTALYRDLVQTRRPTS